MHAAKILTTGITAIALAFSMLASTLPANAASGFHAAYFSESDFLARSPGQTGQFAVGYTNTGDQAWVKGAANQQANLGTAAPLDNTTDFAAGWSNGWLSANRYTAQNAALVAPGQIGFFIYNFTVPANAAAGEHRFYGRPVIDGVTYMEDYGYYQSAVVTASNLKITSTSPASPSSNSTPVVNGTGAGPSAAVTIMDGASQVGSGVADSTGAFSIPTSSLAEGSHSLTACAGGACSAPFTYSVDSTAPVVSSVSAPNASTVIATFNEAVDPTTSQTSTNYTIDGGVTVTSATLGTDGRTVTLAVAAMTSPSGHSLTVMNVQDLAGNVMTTQVIPFTVNDITGPSLASASSTAPAGGGNATTVKATWSEPVVCNGGTTTYNVDGVTATYNTGTGTTKCTLNLGTSLAPGTTHTLTATNEKDTAGNTQSPNPASATFTVATASTTSLVLASAGNPSGETVQAVYNIATSCATPATCASPGPTGTYTIQTAGGFALTHGAVTNDATNANADDMTLTTNPFGADLTCVATATSCTLQLTVTAETGANGETMLPTTQSTTFTFTKDTAAPTLVSAAQSGTTQTIFVATWSQTVAAPNACNTTTCAFRIMSGSTIVASTIPAETATSITLVASGTGTDKKTTLTAGSAVPGGAYNLTVAAGAVNDVAFTPNTNAAGSTPLAVLDSGRPTILTFAPAAGQCGAGQACKTFTFTYSEKMATSGTGNVIDLSHYTLNGAAVSGTASVDSTGSIVTLNLTSSAPCTAGTSPCNESFSVAGVTDVAGNLINPNPTVENYVRTF